MRILDAKRTWGAIALSAALAITGTACSGSGDDDDDDGSTNPIPGVACDGGVCTLSGTIVDDFTLTADTQWVLRGGVFIGDDVNQTILTVEPGTTIYGESSTLGMLVIRRHSRLMAAGTVSAPIVFTSAKNPGTRARGDWGGLIINGLAPINGCDEAPCEGFGEGGTGFYGGDDPADNSGVLQHVRVEFAGRLISPDNELNGIAFQGVGSGTTVDHIQVHMTSDDGVEFFGGTVNAKHVLVTGAGDDMLDWTEGWVGQLQFFIGQQYDDTSDNGIEADNNAEDNDAAPRSHPIISNITLIGSPASTSSDIGVLLREGTAAELHNVIVTGFNEACIDVDHAATFAQATSGNLVFASSIINCTTPYLEDGGSEPMTVSDFVNVENSGNTVADPMLSNPYVKSGPNFAPGGGSPALSGAVQPAGSFFEGVTYRGGMDPSLNWASGWTTDAEN